ncbi:ERCC4 domain-containing protein [Pseudomassariella vexata]|uniref:ERCC4 domain-domain-containing protein n=1 Tax=Pseudomassariella vexata TaxID=1141098 RepID=A0A1Y2DL48_9PEZI|nr:ERCC4 domain-containing protein [Pseudomassariella vexata]ORY60028.1 ERCC4 domain-domain-containing protein [Pseudomassariella vexata]
MLEVISLLSSPSVPSPLVPAPEARVAPPNLVSPPARALDYDSDQLSVLDLTVVPQAEAVQTNALRRSKELIAAPKRATAGKRPQDYDDFLFLSDDFDTTGDLGDSFATKSRASPGSTGKSETVSRSITRTTSALVGVKSSSALLPAGIKRWNSAADPIQHSSSPVVDLSHETGYFARPPPNVSENSRGPKYAPRYDISRIPSATSSTNATSTKRPQKRQNDVLDLSSDPFGTSSPPARKQSPKRKANWDPISSSMPEVSTTREHDSLDVTPERASKKRVPDVIDLDSDMSNSEDDFPELGAIRFSKIKSKSRSYSESPPHKRTKTAQTSPRKKRPPKTAEEKQLEKEQKAAAREAEKEYKQREKEKAKRQKALEKERAKALAEVNKLRTDKKVSTPEMIVDLPSTFGAGISIQINQFLKDLDVQHESWNSPVDNVVKWRRKVTSKFNEDLGYWEPVPIHIKPEKHVAVVIDAAGFVRLALGEEGYDLEAHVLKMKRHFHDNTLIYLIEGLTPWMRKNRNVRNRQFVSAVRGEDRAPASNQPRRRNAAAPQDYIDEDRVEDALISLQVEHGVSIIHHTNISVETAQWIATFTQHISTIPYRKARDASAASAGFCMDAGQVRNGEGAKETYICMLQEITRVTASVAHGIAAEYETVQKLVRGFESKGPLALEGCKKTANKDGAFTDRVVGQAISRRLYKIFMGRDAESTDV